MANPLKPAQEALKNKQYAAALQRFMRRRPAEDPVRPVHDRRFGCNANIGAGNYADAAKDCETRLNGSFVPEADGAQLTQALLA